MSLVVTQLQHTYSPGTPFAQDALRDLNLELAPGERVALIGHTGSGKSTLVQILAGLLKPSVGQVLLDGCEFSGGSEAAKTARRRVGLVFQYPEHQLFEETVSADIAFGPRNAGLPEEEVAREALCFDAPDAVFGVRGVRGGFPEILHLKVRIRK